jgi:hypothetical protein
MYNIVVRRVYCTRNFSGRLPRAARNAGEIQNLAQSASAFFSHTLLLRTYFTAKSCGHFIGPPLSWVPLFISLFKPRQPSKSLAAWKALCTATLKAWLSISLSKLNVASKLSI